MTSKAAATIYEAQHNYRFAGNPVAVYNPNNSNIDNLPVIFGFNNGGSPQFFMAQLIAEDGTPLGNHACSAESYMPHDLGILEGTRPDRHEMFRGHYPSGYRMEFVPSSEYTDGKPPARLQAAIDAYHANQPDPAPEAT